MGLGVVVGVLAELAVSDPEGADWAHQELDHVNRTLEEHRLPLHQEPVNCPVWSGQGYGYSGLHALREVAALVWLGLPIPRDALLDGTQNSAGDVHFDSCVKALNGPKPVGLMGKLMGKRTVPVAVPPFIHLAAHSDAQGYYVPADFAVPLVPARTQDGTAHLWPLGSTPRLEAELNALALALEMPADLSSQDSTLAVLLDEFGAAAADPIWKAQPIAAYSCAVLRDACRHAKKTGAAIAFS